MNDPQDHSEEVLRGVVERVTFHNPQNNYAVIQLATEEHAKPVTVVGNCMSAKVGVHLTVRGSFTMHPKFGLQFAANGAEEVAPSTPAGIEKYLGSGFIKGLGERTAGKLVRAFGDKTLEVLLQHPERVTAVPGIGKRKAALIAAALSERGQRLEIERFFAEHNVGRGLIERVYERYGSRAIEVIRKDPYILAYEMRGVGFATADSIALNLGLAPDAPQRLKAGFYYALEKACDEGHCFLDGVVLRQKALQLLGVEQDADFEPLLESLVREELVVRRGDAVYLRPLFEAEEFAAGFAARRLQPFPKNERHAQIAEACLREAEQDLGIEFSREQREAVRLAVRYPMLIVTGGPGCGKTTTIRALALTFNKMGKALGLAAPTGKAAQRMAQVCGMPASTIHRLLKFEPLSGTFKYGVTNPLKVGTFGEEEAEAVIVDESSMVDILLARDLFSAIPAGAHLILVGDKDQLPSVGPGRVFGELLAAKELKAVVLSHLFRRSEESRITLCAHQINAGITPEIPAPDGETRSDAYFIEKRDIQEAARTVENLVADQMPRKFGLAPGEIAVLTPSNRGPLGTIELNRRLQARLNPCPDTEQLLEAHGEQFRVRDRVCQRVNNYRIDEHGVFNGDTGEIRSVNRQNQSMVVELWDGRLINYDRTQLGQLSLSYAVSVHRAQGSEMPCVVLVLHESHYTLLERQLLYTAVTRAKRLLVIVGTRRALDMAVKRTTTRRRGTKLQERLEALAQLE